MFVCMENSLVALDIACQAGLITPLNGPMSATGGGGLVLGTAIASLG